MNKLSGQILMRHGGKLLIAAVAFGILSGCASLDAGRSVADADQISAEILRKPISQGDALRLALINSLGVQLMLAQTPVQLTGDTIDQVTQVRQAWVNAVAAQQNLFYAQQVNDAAEAGAELARRLHAAGNFSKLQRAREQAFYADAAAYLAVAQHAAVATREALVRLLGLTGAQAYALILPSRLPDLPKEPYSPGEVSRQVSAGRLTIILAQVVHENATPAQGSNRVGGFTDIELSMRRNTVVGNAAGSNLRERYSTYRTAYDLSKHYRTEVVPLRKAISDENLLRYNGMLIGVFALLADMCDQVNSVVAAIAMEQQFWLADAALQAAIMGRSTLTAMGAISTRTVGCGSDAAH